jgi:flagellar assembly protein FliH
MSSRARRLSVATATATPVTSWIEMITDGSVSASGRRAATIVAGGAAGPAPALAAAGAPQPAVSPAQEKEIFAKGFAQGERAGAQAAQQQNAALAKQLTTTLEDLMRVRNEMIRHTEKQMVQLALAVARRVVHREVATNTDTLLAMMRVALERLSDAAKVTVRLNPVDHQSITAGTGNTPSAHVTLAADPRIARGGCKVESEYGDIDAGVDAQIQEIARALLGDQHDAKA